MSPLFSPRTSPTETSATTRAEFSLRLTTGNVLPLSPGRLFTSSELPGLDSGSGPTVAEVNRHPSNPSLTGLKNLSRRTWFATTAAGERRTIVPGRSIQLAHGTHLSFGPISGTIEAAGTPRRSNQGASGQRTGRRRTVGSVLVVLLTLAALAGWIVTGLWRWYAEPMAVVMGIVLCLMGLLALWSGTAVSLTGVIWRDRPGLARGAGLFVVIWGVCLIVSHARSAGAQACAEYGEYCLSHGQTEKAITAFNKAIELDPDSSRYYFRRGLMHGSQKDWDLALADLDEVIHRQPQLVQAYAARAEIHLALKQWQKAAADAQRARELKGAPGKVHLTLAVALSEQDQFAAAVKAADDFLREEPQSAVALAVRGRCRYRLGQVADALTDLDESIRLDPATRLAYVARAEMHGANTDWEQAEKDAEMAIQLDPKDAPRYFLRGKACFHLQKYEVAIDALTSYLRLVPDSAEGFLYRADSHLKFHHFEEASADARQAIRLDAKLERAYHIRVYACYNLKKDQTTIDAATAYLRILPDDFRGYLIRSDCHFVLKHFPQAEADCRKVMSLKPDCLEAYRRCGQCCQELKAFDRAIEVYSEYLRRKPDAFDGYIFRSYCHCELHHHAEAEADAQRILRLKPNPQTAATAYLLRASVAADKSEWERAIREMDGAIRLSPRDPRLYRVRADFLKAAGQLDRALEDSVEAARLEKAKSK